MLTSKPSLLDRLKAGVQKTRAGLMEKLEDAISGRKEIDTDVLDELEYALITADIGAATTAEILERIRQRVERHLVGDSAELKFLIRQYLLEILHATERPVTHRDYDRRRKWDRQNDFHRKACQPVEVRRKLRFALRRRHVPRRRH
jgi:signal recognition particle GTPase